MKRPLSGSLEHIAPFALLRLVSATSPSGILEIGTDRGSLRLEVDRGRVRVPTDDEIRRAAHVLASHVGEFRFQPSEVERIEGGALSLSAFAEAAAGAGTRSDVDRLSAFDGVDAQPQVRDAEIHVLPAEEPENPLQDLVDDLETEAPGELLFATLGVVAQDPRPWRGSVEREWRQRGWRLELLPFAAEADLAGCDLLIVHHQQAAVRVGHESEWLNLIARASSADPPVPVVWAAPLGDSGWVHRLIDAGVAFLMPAPQGETGEAITRFMDGLTRVVDRQLQDRRGHLETGLPASISELVGALLSQSDPDEGVRSLLSLAAEKFSRGAVLIAGATAIRARAGFGYPLNREVTALPRGVGLLERVIRSGEAVLEIDPSSGSARGLAEVCGVDVLPAATALIPLGRFGAVAGVLVADRLGDDLPDLDDLVVLVGRLGGAVVP